MIFIGDVHGWLDRLQDVLQQLPDDEPLCFMGDLIDRGDESADVVALVRKLSLERDVRCIIGNHEYAAVRSFGCPALGIEADHDMLYSWLMYHGGDVTMFSYGYVNPVDFATDEQWLDDLNWFAHLHLVVKEGDSLHGMQRMPV